MNRLNIFLNHFFEARMVTSNNSAFYVPACAFEDGNSEELSCELLFTRLFDNTYDLICAAFPDTHKVYIPNPDGLMSWEEPDTDRLLVEQFVNIFCGDDCPIEYNNMNRIRLITPCGDMGTVIDIKVVQKNMRKRILFDGIVYLQEGGYCHFCDSNEIFYEIINYHGTYVVFYGRDNYANDDDFSLQRVEATPEIKEKVRLI